MPAAEFDGFFELFPRTEGPEDNLMSLSLKLPKGTEGKYLLPADAGKFVFNDCSVKIDCNLHTLDVFQGTKIQKIRWFWRVRKMVKNKGEAVSPLPFCQLRIPKPEDSEKPVN